MSAMTIGVGCMGAASPQRLWSRDYFLAFIVLVGAQLVFVTLMAYMALYALKRFSVNDAAAGFAASSFVLGAAVARLVVGKYLDFIGRKRALLLALTLYALCSLVYPMIDHYGVLIAIRIMQGTGFGVTSTTVATAVIDMIPPGRLSEGLGYIALAGTLSNALGPLAAIQLSQHASSEWVFGFTAGCAVLSFLAVTGMRIQERTPTPTQYARKWQLRLSDLIDGKVLPVAFVALIASTGFALVMTYLTPYMVGLQLADVASVFFLVWALAMLAVRLFAGRVHDRYGDNAVVPAALVSLACGLGLLAVATAPWHFLIAAALGGMGHGAVIPSLQAVGIGRTTTERIPVATSTHYLALDTGIAMGPVALGFVLHFVGYPGMFLVGSCVMLLGVGLYWLVHGRTRQLVHLG